MPKDNSILIFGGLAVVGAVGAIFYFSSQKPVLNTVTNTNLPIQNPQAPVQNVPVPTFTKGQQCATLLKAISNHDTAIASARERMNTVLAQAKSDAEKISYQAECRYAFGICGGYGPEIVKASLLFVTGENPSIFAGLNPDEGGAKLIRDNPSWSSALVAKRERYLTEKNTADRETNARAAKIAQVETLRAEGVIC